MDPQGRAMDLSIGNNAHLYTVFGYEEIINTIAKKLSISFVQESNFFPLKFAHTL